MPKRLITYSATQPARAILAVACIITLLAGLFIFTPWFEPSALTPAVSTVYNVSIYAGAVVNLLVTLPGMLGVFTNRPKWIASGAFAMFVWYLFVTVARLTSAVVPVTMLLWVPHLIVSLVMAIVYLEQRTLVRREADD
jgi:hypothetical protein